MPIFHLLPLSSMYLAATNAEVEFMGKGFPLKPARTLDFGAFSTSTRVVTPMLNATLAPVEPAWRGLRWSEWIRKKPVMLQGEKAADVTIEVILSFVRGPVELHHFQLFSV